MARLERHPCLADLRPVIQRMLAHLLKLEQEKVML
jgi:hypothetical protein